MVETQELKLNEWISLNGKNEELMYKIWWPYTTKFNSDREAVDIYVKLDRPFTSRDFSIDLGTYVGTFITFEQIKWLMEGYKKTGECAGGKYFPGNDLLFVHKISHQVITKTLQDLLEKNEFGDYFKKSK